MITNFNIYNRHDNNYLYIFNIILIKDVKYKHNEKLVKINNNISELYNNNNNNNKNVINIIEEFLYRFYEIINVLIIYDIDEEYNKKCQITNDIKKRDIIILRTYSNINFINFVFNHIKNNYHDKGNDIDKEKNM